MTIADVAERAGVSKTAVSFAFNSPDRLNAGDRAAGSSTSPSELGYRPDPVARMLTQRRTGRDRRPDPAGPVGHLHQPVLRGVQRGDRGRRRGARLRAPFHLAPPRLAVAGDPPGDRRRRRRDRPDRRPPRDRRDPAGRACRWSSSTRTRRATWPRSTSTTRAARSLAAAPPPRARPPRHRDPRDRRAARPRRHAADGVVGRRLRGYRTALAEAGIDVRRRTRSPPGPPASTAADAAFDRPSGRPAAGRPPSSR